MRRNFQLTEPSQEGTVALSRARVVLFFEVCDVDFTQLSLFQARRLESFFFLTLFIFLLCSAVDWIRLVRWILCVMQEFDPTLIKNEKLTSISVWSEHLGRVRCTSSPYIGQFGTQVDELSGPASYPGKYFTTPISSINSIRA